jgi:hypothetical protein
MPPVPRIVSCMLAAGLLLNAVGCTTLNVSKIDFRSRKATARNPAVKVVCLWEPAEGRDPKGVPCQGFAGQILFLTNTSLPVSVEGDVRIYLFDDKGTVEEQGKPLHHFDFDSGAWSRHYTYGTLGPAYNVFVPYMRRGVPDATCALRIRLTPKEGPAVFSDMTSIKLLGFENANSKFKAPETDSRVEQTIPEDLTAVNKRRRTTTIVLNSQNGVASDSAESLPGHAGSDAIQQASFEAEAAAKPLTNDDSRIQQLEQMVEELRALQSTNPIPPAKKPTSAATPPRLLEDSRESNDEGDTSSARIKVRSSKSAQIEQQIVHSARQAPAPDFVNERAESEIDSRTVAAQRRPHPLDDSAPVRTGSLFKRAPFSTETTELFGDASTSNRSVPQRHPLDDDDHLLERATPGPGRHAHASEAPPATEDFQGGSVDPFDPIDTDAIETTSVQSSPAIRSQLRAANR